MMDTEVEMLYFKNDVKRIRGIDISKDKINEICAKLNVELKMKDKTPGNMPQLSINLSGTDETTLKGCIREIVSLYGKPDLPSGFLMGAEKKRGNELVKAVNKEFAI